VRAPDFWRSGARTPWPALLAPLGAAYGGLGRLRGRLTTAKRAPAAVVCIGNLVAGGAGKTPVALALAGHLAGTGKAVHFLTRGYGGRLRGPARVDPGRHDAGDVGDEALLLARAAPTWVARDRAAGALAAAAAGAEIVVMDDGHQNPTLIKDVSLVVVDAAYGVGNGRLIPAGPLREPVARGLARADAVVLIGDGPPEATKAVRTAAADMTVLRAQLVPGPGAAGYADRDVVAFAGIARPEKFFATLGAVGARLIATYAFADHHRYDATEIMALVEEATLARAHLVTTEKDAVRLPAEARDMVEILPVTAEFADPALLGRVLAPVLGDG